VAAKLKKDRAKPTAAIVTQASDKKDSVTVSGGATVGGAVTPVIASSSSHSDSDTEVSDDGGAGDVSTDNLDVKEFELDLDNFVCVVCK